MRKFGLLWCALLFTIVLHAQSYPTMTMAGVAPDGKFHFAAFDVNGNLCTGCTGALQQAISGFVPPFAPMGVGTDGKFHYFLLDANGNLKTTGTSSSANPGGSTGDVQYNCSNAFCGDAHTQLDGNGNLNVTSITTTSPHVGYKVYSAGDGVLPTSLPANSVVVGAASTVTESYYEAEPAGPPPDNQNYSQVCSVTSSSPYVYVPCNWVVVPGGSFGGRIGQTTLGSDTGSITFASIPSIYTNLMLVLSGAVSGSVDSAIFLNFNGDSGTNYSYAGVYNSGNSSAGFFGTNTNEINSGGVIPQQPNVGAETCTIANYSSALLYKAVTCNGGGWQTSGNWEQVNISGQWQSTAPITQIVISPFSANLKAGFTATLYGMP